jgi:CRP-like cAMP-binding protein
MSTSAARANWILERLPSRERKTIAAVIEDVGFSPGELICGAGSAIKHLYFPREGVISLFAGGKAGPDVGVGLIRDDGMFGLSVAVGQPTSQLLAVAQGSGRADRIESGAFLSVLPRCPAMREALLRYSHDVAEQMSRNVVCVAHHPARTRLARWMLDITTGSRNASFSSTQAATAVALGLQRPAVSYAASALQRLGLIRYLRGEVTILNRRGLRALACTCSA